MNPQTKSTRNLLIGVLVCGVLLTGIFATVSVRAKLLAPTPTLDPTAMPAGVIDINPAQTLTDFSLPGDDGKPLHLSDLRGKDTLLFFGYTHCPDFCPETLSRWKTVKQDLGSDAANVNFLFISVDGGRDTPAVMTKYLAIFDPSFIGMSGDDVTLGKIKQEYGLDYYLHKEQGPNYSVDHTTQEYLVNPQGQLIIEYDFDTDASVIAQTIQTTMSSSTSE